MLSCFKERPHDEGEDAPRRHRLPAHFKRHPLPRAASRLCRDRRIHSPARLLVQPGKFISRFEVACKKFIRQFRISFLVHFLSTWYLVRKIRFRCSTFKVTLSICATTCLIQEIKKKPNLGEGLARKWKGAVHK